VTPGSRCAGFVLVRVREVAWVNVTARMGSTVRVPELVTVALGVA
jgi:hypothetical protein